MGQVNGSGPAGITRREFIQVTSVATAGMAFAPGLASGEAAARARVILVRDADALDAGGNPRPDVLQKMLDRGICELLGVKQPVDGWKQLLGQAATVGIKTNVWANLRTPPCVEASIQQRIMETGIPKDKISVDDRGARRTLASSTTLVNVRPLRTHHWAGIGGCLKNPIMFSEEPSFYHPDMCADLGTLWKLPVIKDKIKLNVLMVLTPQFLTRSPHHFDPRYVWPYGGILMSTDPVAVDSVGVRLLEAKRKIHFGEERSLSQLAHHVRFADERHGLGVSDPARIDLVKVGWEKEILI